jgi:phage terminase Nu1 subunit (DNA packaging protein)
MQNTGSAAHHEGWATQAEVAEHLDLSQPSVSRMVKDGLIKAEARGRYDLAACRVAYIQHLRAQAAGRQSTAGGVGSLEAERARLAKEQADAKAMENAVTRGELVKASEVAATWEQIGTEVKRVLLSIPADVAPLLDGKKTTAQREAIVRSRVEEALEALTGTRVDAEPGDDAGD